MNIAPPKTQKELLSRLDTICQHGSYIMPEERYQGTGAPGIFLEDLLGLSTGNKDIPDSLGCELKYYTVKTNYLTLFHKEPKPRGIMRYMVSKFGWKDDEGRLSFRHTIAGKSDRFRVVSDAGQIIVRPLEKANGLVPCWTSDVILSTAGAKLRRLLCVRGEKKGQQVTYNRIDFYENLLLTDFIDHIVRGIVLIDFDAREMTPGSKGLRNHGTKFRVTPDNVGRLYSKKNRL